MTRTALIANAAALIGDGDAHAAKMAFIGIGRNPTESEAIPVRAACVAASIHPSHFGAAMRPSLDIGSIALRSHVLFGKVPAYPSESDFHMAVSRAVGNADLAAHWRLEAIRWRRSNPGETLDLPVIHERALARHGRAIA